MTPIKPENRILYPADWPVIAREVKDDAYWICQCDGRCGIVHTDPCGAKHGEASPLTGSKVVLTAAHLDHDPTNNGEPHRRPNLMALCMTCHLAYDADHHAETRATTQAGKAAALAAELAAPTLDGIEL